MTEPIKQPEPLQLADALSGVMYSADDVVKAAAELRRLHGEVERLRAELDRRTTLNPAKEMLGWTPKEPK
jgi:AmiR/NasT family two-component response regulator